jgi:diguanylate cyclase (GGDEF)-like protein/PAS domain S-box-containing protein
MPNSATELAPGAVQPCMPTSFEKFFTLSPDLLAIANSEGYFVTINDAWTETLGYNREELCRRPFIDFVHRDDLLATERMLSRAASGQSVTHFENRYSCKDGSYAWLNWTATIAPETGLLYTVARNVSSVRGLQQEAARRLDELEARAGQLSLLSDMGELLQSCRGMSDAQQVIELFMPRIFPKHVGAVYVLEGDRTRAKSLAGFGGAVAEGFDSSTCWALRRGREHWSTGPLLALDCGHARTRNLAHVCIPLMAQGEAKGVLHLELPADDEGEHNTPPAPRFVVTVADQLALAIANVSLRETLESQSVRDPLTGLFNRRYLEEALHQRLRDAQLSGEPVSVAMLDIDHFKNFNDEHGHLTADDLLGDFARFLEKRFRKEDVVCRFGGEEFVVILPGATPQQALRRVDSARRALETVRTARAANAGVTFSAGVAGSPMHGATSAALLRAADAAMYRSKSAGRDCTHVAEAPKPSLIPSLSPAPLDDSSSTVSIAMAQEIMITRAG